MIQIPLLFQTALMMALLPQTHLLKGLLPPQPFRVIIVQLSQAPFLIIPQLPRPRPLTIPLPPHLQLFSILPLPPPLPVMPIPPCQTPILALPPLKALQLTVLLQHQVFLLVVLSPAQKLHLLRLLLLLPLLPLLLMRMLPPDPSLLILTLPNKILSVLLGLAHALL